MLRKFPEFEFAHSSTVTANIFPTLHTMNFCTFQGHNVHRYRFHWFLPDPWPLWLCCIVWTDYRNIKRLFACGCVKPWGEVNRDRLMSSFNVPEFQHFLRRNSCSVRTHTTSVTSRFHHENTSYLFLRSARWLLRILIVIFPLSCLCVEVSLRDQQHFTKPSSSVIKQFVLVRNSVMCYPVITSSRMQLRLCSMF